MTNSVFNSSVERFDSQSSSRLFNEKNMDMEKMCNNINNMTRKVDLDYIPGLDDELKIILPGKLASYFFIFFQKALNINSLIH